jgi:hypothetical protein
VEEVEMGGTPLPTIIDIDENEEKTEEEGVRGRVVIFCTAGQHTLRSSGGGGKIIWGVS